MCICISRVFLNCLLSFSSREKKDKKVVLFYLMNDLSFLPFILLRESKIQYVMINKEYLDFIVQEAVGKTTYQLDHPGNVVTFL